MTYLEDYLDAVQGHHRDAADFINPDNVDPDAAWKRVDVVRLWPRVLFPLLDSSPSLQRELEQGLVAFRNFQLWIDIVEEPGHRTPWTYAGASSAPYHYTLWDQPDLNPNRETDVRWVRPQSSCHWIAPFTLALARAWRPDVCWSIVPSINHSTVVCVDRLLIFDVIVLDGADPEPIWYALRDPRSAALSAITSRPCLY